MVSKVPHTAPTIAATTIRIVTAARIQIFLFFFEDLLAATSGASDVPVPPPVYFGSLRYWCCWEITSVGGGMYSGSVE